MRKAKSETNAIPHPESSLLTNGDKNTLKEEDRPFHDWYRFVLSYPPHLVRDYLTSFGLPKSAVIIDPFCGTGTTLVEAKLNGFRSIGLEANPVARFAAEVKTDWTVSSKAINELVEEVHDTVWAGYSKQGINDDMLVFPEEIEPLGLSEEASKALIRNSISPKPLHKVLELIAVLDSHSGHPAYSHLRLALAKAIVTTISNLKFAPEVGVGKIKDDVPVLHLWRREAEMIARDLSAVNRDNNPESITFLADSREDVPQIGDSSIDAVITSPPYPNEKDYTRTTRLESVLLGFYSDRKSLRLHKQNLLRSNTRGVYREDDDHLLVKEYSSITAIADEIEAERIRLGKTSGFERLYPKVTKLYFGGMLKHLQTIHRYLKSGALLAYVVGDQASYLKVMIRTADLLAEIAEQTGYRVVRKDLFRTRYATATKDYLNEEVLILEKK